MPRHKEAKKDAANGETQRRAVSKQRPVDIRMGEPIIYSRMISRDEYIVTMKRDAGN